MAEKLKVPWSYAEYKAKCITKCYPRQQIISPKVDTLYILIGWGKNDKRSSFKSQVILLIYCEISLSSTLKVKISRRCHFFDIIFSFKNIFLMTIFRKAILLTTSWNIVDAYSTDTSEAINSIGLKKRVFLLNSFLFQWSSSHNSICLVMIINCLKHIDNKNYWINLLGIYLTIKVFKFK